MVLSKNSGISYACMKRVFTMKSFISFLVLLALLFALDWQQRFRAESMIEDLSDLSGCSEASPCTLRSVPADICSILSRNRSFLGRSFYPQIAFTPDRPCRRSGRHDVYFWFRES